MSWRIGLAGVIGLAVAVAIMVFYEPNPYAYIPGTVSPEAQEHLSLSSDPATRASLPAPRNEAGWRKLRQQLAQARERYTAQHIDRFDVLVSERQLGPLSALEVTPEGYVEDGHRLVYFHGGGYVVDSARSKLLEAALMADGTGWPVISVNHPNAPEARWWEILDASSAALIALEQQGLAMSELALVGDSAGGGLVTGLTLKRRDEGFPLPAALVLWSPWTDLSTAGDTRETLKDADPAVSEARLLRPAAEAYAPESEWRRPYVSPVYGEYSDDFPPTLIQGGTKEILLSDFVRLYRAIRDGGGHVELDLYEGMPHLFQLPMTLDGAPEGEIAMRVMRDFLRTHLPDTQAHAQP